MANTFIIKEDVVNEVKNVMKPTESQFNSNVRYFLHQLLDDPVHAEVPTCIRMANISRSKFIKMLIDRGIVKRTEKLNDKDKDGNPKTATMLVKYSVVDKVPDELEYKVSKTDFDRRVEKLRRSIFEKNLPEKKFNTPLGDQLAVAKNSPLTIGFVAPANNLLTNQAAEVYNSQLKEDGEGGATSADASGQFSQPLFGVIRRKIEEKFNSNKNLSTRYRNLGGGFQVQLEDGSVEESLVTIQNKQTKTLYHICFDGANFNIYRDMNNGQPCSHVSYVFDQLLNAFDDNGYVDINEEVEELRAKHSSNANFDKFDSSYMGNGCGSQAYGWGHYVSTKGSVSRGYKRHFKENPGYIEGGMKRASYFYTVEIPDDNGRNYISWDGPSLPNLPYSDKSNTFGEQYRLICQSNNLTPKEVSLKLADMGYTGIKTQPYRNNIDPERRGNVGRGANYVIFRDEDIKIISKKERVKNAERCGKYIIVGKRKGYHIVNNLYDPSSGTYLFNINENEWPQITRHYKEWYEVYFNNSEFYSTNLISSKTNKFIFPETDIRKWPKRVEIFPNNYFYGSYQTYGTQRKFVFHPYSNKPLFGDIENPETGAFNVGYDFNDGVILVFMSEEGYLRNNPDFYISKDGKIVKDKFKAKNFINKVKDVLSRPVFKESINGKVFKITEEQLQQLKEVTATTTVGGPNTDYQYTVPFPTDSSDETMKRHNGEGGSVSINHVDESNKESLHTSNVGDYINDNPIEIHPEDPTMKRGEGKHGSHGIERIEEGKNYVNMNVELRKGGRNAVKMSVEDFKNEMIHAYHEYAIEQEKEHNYDLQKTPTPSNFVYSLCYDNRDNEKSKVASMLHKDIWGGKYDFDTENVDSIGGIKMSRKGFPYIQCDAGGDWECPVCFFVYFDGNHFRAYVPLKGNALNRNENHAFSGGGNEDDAKFVEKELGVSYEEADGLCGDINYNLDACLEDFLSRVEVKGMYKKHDYSDYEKKFDEYKKKKKEESEERKRQREIEQSVEYEEPKSETPTPLNEEQQDFLQKHGIKEVSCGLGYSEKEEKWYGWSHRAIHGFGIGDKSVECYPTGSKEGKKITTLEQAKEAAKKFAESVS